MFAMIEIRLTSVDGARLSAASWEFLPWILKRHIQIQPLLRSVWMLFFDVCAMKLVNLAGMKWNKMEKQLFFSLIFLCAFVNNIDRILIYLHSLLHVLWYLSHLGQYSVLSINMWVLFRFFSVWNFHCGMLHLFIYKVKATDLIPVKFVIYSTVLHWIQARGIYKSTWILKIYFVYLKCDIVLSIKQESQSLISIFIYLYGTFYTV